MADDRRDDNKGHHARPAASADEPETAAPADKRQCHDRDELSVAAGLHGCSIPIFIWEHVFSFLSTRDAAVASLVCWDWRGIWESAPFWADGRFLFIKHEHLPYLARNFNVCRHIQHISVSGSVADYDGVGKYQQIPPFEKYVSALPRQIAPYFRPGSFANLVSLSTEIPLVKEDMEFLATNAPNLKVLDVLDHDVGHFFDGGECDTAEYNHTRSLPNFPELETLGTVVLNKTGLRDVAACSRLKTLWLCGRFNGVDDHINETLLPRCTNLATLSLNIAGGVYDNLHLLSELRSLSIEMLPYNGSMDMIVEALKCPKLEKFTFEVDPLDETTGETLAALPEGFRFCPSLRVLHIRTCLSGVPGGFSPADALFRVAIMQCPDLEKLTLDLSESCCVSDAGIAGCEIVSMCPKLCLFSDSKEAISVASIVKAWPLLERIDLGPNRALCSLKQLRELARATNLVEMHAGYDMGFGDGAGVMDDLSIWTTVFTWFKPAKLRRVTFFGVAADSTFMHGFKVLASHAGVKPVLQGQEEQEDDH